MTGDVMVARGYPAELCTVPAIAVLIRRLDFGEAVRRLLARRDTGMNVPSRLVADTLPYVRDTANFLQLLVCCDGDRAEMIGDLLERRAFASDPLSASLQVLALGAWVALGNPAQRARAAIWARQHVVRCLYEPGAIHTVDGLMCMQERLRDGYLDGLLAIFHQSSSAPIGHTPLASALSILWSALDATADGRDSEPYSTVLELAPLPVEEALFAHRHQPCACGSGETLGRCCMTKLRADVRERTPTLLAASPPLPEVVIQGAALLPVNEVRTRIHRLLEARAFEEADALVSELARRGDVPAEQTDDARFEILCGAVACQRWNWVLRQVRELRTERYRLQIEVARTVVAIGTRAPDALELLLKTATAAVQDRTGDTALSLASALVAVAPGLSLALFRGVMHLPNAYRGELVLREVAHVGVAIEAVDPSGLNDEPARRIAEAMSLTAREKPGLAELRAQLKDTEVKVRASEQRNAELQRQLDDVRGELRVRTELRPVAAVEPEELRRLRDKNNKLEALLRDKNDEIRRLNAENARGGGRGYDPTRAARKGN